MIIIFNFFTVPIQQFFAAISCTKYQHDGKSTSNGSAAAGNITIATLTARRWWWW